MYKLVALLLVAASIISAAYFYKTQFQSPQTTPVIGTSLTFKEPKYKINSQEVKYFQNVTGYYAEPELKGEYPGVIMIHEWWGLNEHIKEMANQLASQGYRVLAVDLFGSVAKTPEEARKQVVGLNQDIAVQNMKAAKKFLNDSGSKRVGSLGWCFGGAQSLQISINDDLDATVIYYGNLVLDENKIKNLKSPVLGIFGNKDNSIPVENVLKFEQILKNSKIQNDINIYEGVGHAFANPSGQNFSPKETIDAWNKTLNFLESNLK